MKVILGRENLRKPIILEQLDKSKYYTTKQIKENLLLRPRNNIITRLKSHINRIDELIRLCTTINSYRIIGSNKVYIRKCDLQKLIDFYRRLKNRNKYKRKKIMCGAKLYNPPLLSETIEAPLWTIYKLIHNNRIKTLKDYKARYWIPYNEFNRLIRVKKFKDHLKTLPQEHKSRTTVKQYVNLLNNNHKQTLKHFKNIIKNAIKD